MTAESSQNIQDMLLESESRLRSIFLAAPVGIGVVVDRIIKDANDRLCDITGYSRDELVGQNSKFLYPTENDYQYVGSEKYRQISEKGTGSVETQWRRKDGKVIDVMLSSTPLNTLDLTAGVTFTALDITERKQAEYALRESEQRYRLLAEKMNDIIWTADLGLRSTYVSPSVEKVLGFTVEERMSQNTADQMTTESFVRATEILTKELERELEPGNGPDRTVKMDIEYYHKNGSIVWCKNIVGALRDENGTITGIHGVSRDITERKLSDKALQHEKQRFHNLIHNAPFGMLMIDKYGIFNYANPKFTEIFGYDLLDVPDGKTWFELAYPDPEYRMQVVSAWIEDLYSYESGEKRPRVFEVTCKDGSRKIINFIPVSLKTGENIISYEDITERITLEAQLRQAQKMESVGRLAGGVAHDFNNMLQAIMGYAELAMLSIQSGEAPDANLIQISKAAQRAANLVRQLLAFARKQIVSPKVMDLE